MKSLICSVGMMALNTPSVVNNLLTERNKSEKGSVSACLANVLFWSGFLRLLTKNGGFDTILSNNGFLSDNH